MIQFFSCFLAFLKERVKVNIYRFVEKIRFIVWASTRHNNIPGDVTSVGIITIEKFNSFQMRIEIKLSIVLTSKNIVFGNDVIFKDKIRTLLKLYCARGDTEDHDVIRFKYYI